MANFIRVNTDTMNNDSEILSSHIDKISDMIDDIMNNAEELDQMWEGKSHEAFHHALMQDIASLHTILANMWLLVDYEQNAYQKYNECSQRVASLVQEINI